MFPFLPLLILTLPLLPHVSALPLTFPFFPPSSSPGPTSTTPPVPLAPANATTQFLRAAQFSRVAYCTGAAVSSWTCGAPCDSLGGGVEVVQAGGDDGLVPMYFIAIDQATESVIVTHQGTESSSILSIVNDIQIQLVELNTTRFPGVDATIRVHSGFQKTFERTADGVLAGVRSALDVSGFGKVLVTGHSLGAAIATLDALLLKRTLDPAINITTTLFGLPRGGNTAWADFVDANLAPTLTHISNQHDPVPVLPPRFLGYQRPAGEVHVRAVDGDGEVSEIVECDGQENENCSEGNSLFDIDIANHAGPYLGNVSFGGKFCPL
ncbi:Lipase [Hypsizygus marmoreus]|uniref:Lipase n=1 Tax=Hypsizygus marmoreus TaxID=39966 RepID=A0A369JZB4_HYPMA|nr:Lipase [Hypsizygus marmoreus]